MALCSRTGNNFKDFKQKLSLCVTGLYGCQWNTHPTSRTKSVDWLSWVYLLLVLLLLSFTCYFWTFGKNDYDDMAWKVFNTTGQYLHIYSIILIVACAIFAYAALLFLLSLVHFALGIRPRLHWFHCVILCGGVIWASASLVVVQNMWKPGWTLLAMSVMITGPYLHLLLVIIMTLLALIVVPNVLMIKHTAHLFLAITLCAMVALTVYLIPLAISSPCICAFDDLPRKPALIAHRGESWIAPENTLYSLELAARLPSVQVLETDVSISLDGVPFLLHDRTLKRTTDVHTVYPDREEELACNFNISDLRTLNTGTWFLQIDPHRTVSDLSASSKATIRAQRVPTLVEAVQIAVKYNKSVMFDVGAVPETHPHYEDHFNIIVRQLKETQIPQHRIWWLYNKTMYENSSLVPDPHNFTIVYGKVETLEELLELTDVHINVPYTKAYWSHVRSYQAARLTVNVWTINEHWLYSLLWCMGVNSTTTNYASHLHSMKSPLWHMTTYGFMTLALLVDVCSAITIGLIIIYFRRRQALLIHNQWTPIPQEGHKDIIVKTETITGKHGDVIVRLNDVIIKTDSSQV